MNALCHDDKAGKTPQTDGVDKPTHDAKDLTCNKAPVEKLLSEGESTDDETEDEEQA
ncbi:MAG: hypothetical protein HP491_04625 [Nitrospira sp.]|nr:hypothetical protein [Nitrospira sp.]